MAGKGTNEEKEKKLTKQQYKAIDLLISGQYTKTEIAELCDISRRQLYRWITYDEFQEEYKVKVDELRSKFDPRLMSLISSIMNDINPLNFEDEKEKIDSLEKLVKLHQLVNGGATDIIHNEVTGKNGGPIEYENLSDEELLKEAEKYGIKPDTEETDSETDSS